MIEIIPAIDVYQGKCVRLTRGEYSQMTIYHERPVQLARLYEDHGIRRVHLVDLEGARYRKLMNFGTLREISAATHLQIDFGGGIVTDDDLEKIFINGARQVTIGSMAVKDPETFARWLNIYGPERLILGADVREGKIAISGWTEVSSRNLDEFLREYLNMGIKYILCTDIGMDGMLQGPSVELYQQLVMDFPDLKVIASGGITHISDIEKLAELGVYGVIIGKALVEGRISLDDLKAFIESD